MRKIRCEFMNIVDIDFLAEIVNTTVRSISWFSTIIFSIIFLIICKTVGEKLHLSTATDEENKEKIEIWYNKSGLELKKYLICIYYAFDFICIVPIFEAIKITKEKGLDNIFMDLIIKVSPSIVFVILSAIHPIVLDRMDLLLKKFITSEKLRKRIHIACLIVYCLIVVAIYYYIH